MEWLVPEAQRRTTPNIYPAQDPHVQPVEAVICHYTGSRRPQATLRWLCMPESEVSAHFLVSRTGRVWQLAPLSARCWHAGGRSSALYSQPNTNGRTIGIEVMNVGPVEPDGRGGLQTASGRPFSWAAASARHKHPKWTWKAWEAYPPAQVDAVLGLVRQLVRAFPILGHGVPLRFLGHEDVDPTRKADPGPLFPWDEVYDAAQAAYEAQETSTCGS